MIRDGNYILIPSFARTELDLKGNELLLYSLIYGFSQDGHSEFTGSVGYMCEWLGVSKNTVLKTVRGLTEKGLLKKTEFEIGNIILNRYKAVVPDTAAFNPQCNNLTPGAKIAPPGAETEPPGAKIAPPGAETEPNNIVNNIANNIANNKSIGDDKKRKRFIPPTLEEVAAYCRERNNTVDPQHWHDYYSSNGWKVGKNPMKDWKSAVRTWERNGFSNSNQNNQNSKPQSRAGSAFRDIQNSRSYDYDDLQKRLGGFG